MSNPFAYLPLMFLALACGKSAAEGPEPEPQLEPVTIRVASSLPFDGAEGTAALVQRSGVDGDVRKVESSRSEKGEDGTAVFTFDDVATSQGARDWYYGAVYPADAAGAAGKTIYITLPAEQVPRADAPDAAACLFAAWSPEPFSERPNNLALPLNPLFVHRTLSITGLSLQEEEHLLSVSVTVPGRQLAGSIALDTFSGNLDFSSSVDVSTVRLLTSSLRVDEGSLDLHFATKPFSLDDGERLTVLFETDLRSFEVQASSLSVSVEDISPNPGDEGEEDDPLPGPGYTVTGRIWYISPSGDNSAGGTSPAAAVKTFDRVLQLIGPGDQVRIMPGTYEATAWNDILRLEKKHSGTEGNYISFVAHDPDDRPVFHAGGKGVWNAVNCNASYIAFDGIEVCGDNASIKLQDAYDAALGYFKTGSADWTAVAVYNTNGISIGGAGNKSSYPHHVIVRNCLVHDVPGAGLSAIQADWVTFEYNRIYNCAWFMMYGGSGISYLTPVDVDSYTGYKMVVRGNIVSNCHTDVPWVRVGSAFDYSDGNGIIIDVNDGYHGRTLVENNVSYNNGGSGIHGYRASHVDIVGNTAYWNGWKYSGSYGEIWAHQGGDVRIYNNIMYGRPVSENGRCNLGNNAVYTNNLYFQGQVKISGSGDLVADPLFVNLSKDNFEADFHLIGGSPAIGHGSLDMPYLPGWDMEGRARKGRFDCGAYQFSED